MRYLKSILAIVFITSFLGACEKPLEKEPFKISIPKTENIQYFGNKIEINVLENDELGTNSFLIKIDGSDNNSEGNKKSVTNEGLWEVLGSRIIFTPITGFKKAPSPISYYFEYSDKSTSIKSTINFKSSVVANPDVFKTSSLINTFSITANDIFEGNSIENNSRFQVSLNLEKAAEATYTAQDGNTYTLNSQNKIVLNSNQLKNKKGPFEILYKTTDKETGFSDTSKVSIIYQPRTVFDQFETNEFKPLENDASESKLDPKTFRFIGSEPNDNYKKVDSFGNIWIYDPFTGKVTIQNRTSIPSTVSYQVSDEFGNISAETKLTWGNSAFNNMQYYYDFNLNFDNKGLNQSCNISQKLEGNYTFQSNRNNELNSSLNVGKSNFLVNGNLLPQTNGLSLMGYIFLDKSGLGLSQQIFRTSPGPISHFTITPKADNATIKIRILGSTSTFEKEFNINYSLIGKWFHIATTMSKNKYEIYIDGILVAETDLSLDYVPQLWVFDTGGGVGYNTLGDGSRSPPIFYDSMIGNLDDVMIFNKSLSSLEIKTIYTLIK